jgi:hypothetical protein
MNGLPNGIKYLAGKELDVQVRPGHWLRYLGVCLLLSFAAASGCGKPPAPPTPLALEQIPSEMQKVFVTAKAPIKSAVEEIKGALEKKDYPGAYQRVQALCELPELGQDQRMVLTRTSLTLVGLLQTAQTQGDPEATKMLDFVRRTK